MISYDPRTDTYHLDDGRTFTSVDLAYCKQNALDPPPRAKKGKLGHLAATMRTLAGYLRAFPPPPRQVLIDAAGILERLARAQDRMTLTADGFDSAIVGITEHQPGRGRLVAYDVDRMVSVLMKRDKMTQEEAEEFLEFNTFGSWVGDGTPVFVRRKPVGLSIRDYLAEQFKG